MAHSAVDSSAEIRIVIADREGLFTGAVQTEGLGNAPCSIMLSSQMQKGQAEAIVRADVLFTYLLKLLPLFIRWIYLVEVNGVVVWTSTMLVGLLSYAASMKQSIKPDTPSSTLQPTLITKILLKTLVHVTDVWFPNQIIHYKFSM